MTMVWGSKDFLEEYTPIYYFIPGDHDDPINLNVFTIHNSESIEGSFRLETIKKNFPLPGIYSFRFVARLSVSLSILIMVYKNIV
jgi:hypothetical protein